MHLCKLSVEAEIYAPPSEFKKAILENTSFYLKYLIFRLLKEQTVILGDLAVINC